MPISVAIIGAGPAGFYTAEALLKSDQDVAVDIIDWLPTPYGLIRAGVAPDHQTTKKVSRNFARTATNEAVGYYGNIKVGRDVSLAELRAFYDAVVLAVGSPHDRALGIPGEDKAGVFGSAEFVGWYNGHPSFCDLNPDLNTKAVAVIGNGNVAIDVARVLVKTPEEMATSDLPDYAAKAIQESPITDVYMFGRRGPVDAKFTNVELREMGKLETCVPQVDGSLLPDDVSDFPGLSDRDRRLKERNMATLREFAERKADEKPKRVHFEFYAAPVEILGGDRVEGLRLERTKVEEGRAVGTGEFFEIECGLVLAAIGYQATPIEGAPFDAKRGVVPNEDGRVEDGLYAVGWVKRGPTGVIATNRPDGVAVAGHILEDFAKGEKPGREAFEGLLRERDLRPVSFDNWLSIEAAEEANAPAPAPRLKFYRIDAMLEAIGNTED